MTDDHFIPQLNLVSVLVLFPGFSFLSISTIMELSRTKRLPPASSITFHDYDPQKFALICH